MSKHILCAIDLTHDQDARAILAEAGRMAKRDGATLSVVCVLPDYGSSWVGSFFRQGTMKEAATAAMETLRRMVDEVLSDHEQVQCIVEIGTVYEKVIEAISECGADLAVVGAHKPDLADRIIGPNAARVSRHAPVSVLVLRL